MNSERGSLSVLLAGYLALAVLLGVSMSAIGISLVSKNRIQAVTDSAILFAHDRAVKKGIPNQMMLESGIRTFLRSAPSAGQINVQSIEVRVNGNESTLVLCAIYKDPLGVAIRSGVICKSATAKSFRTD